MKRVVATIFCGLLCISSLLFFFGCKKKQTEASFDSGAYSSAIFDVPIKSGFEASLQTVLNDGENTCISVVYTCYDSKGMIDKQVTDIFTVDDNGDTQYTLEIMGDQPPCAVLSNEYAFLGYDIDELEKSNGNLQNLQRTAVFIDKKTGDLVRTIKTSFSPYFIVPLTDGFVIGGYSTIARYSKDGVLVSTIDLGFSLLMGTECFFEDNGHFYAIEEKDLGSIIYHEVDLVTAACTTLATNTDIGIVGMNVEGKYYFNPDGEYKVDFSSMQVDCLADWNCIDIRPPKNVLDTPCCYYRLNDSRFALSYQYRNMSSEVLIFHYDPSIDRSKVETIKIGGFNVHSDAVLQWAVYNFNTTNTDFRVILEEYGDRFDKYTLEEGHTGKLAITQYFNEGNTPDIFYGTRFDYAYMGRNGMVVDLSNYFGSSPIAVSDLTDTAAKLFYDSNGTCYQLFSGYTMCGRSVQEKVFKTAGNMSVNNLFQYAQDNDIPYSLESAVNIVDEAIRYDFSNLWGAYDGIKKISQEELLELVSIALSVPLSETHYASEEDVIYGKSLMSTTVVFCELSEIRVGDNGFHFIGYPSIRDSIHLAQPECCLAISTSSSHKDKCWEVLNMLLSTEAQKQTLISGYIPVTKDMVNTFCEISMHPNLVTDDVLKSYLGKCAPVKQEIIDAFLEIISSADTIETQDYGIYDIICDEINSYYTQSRSPEQIVTTLDQRLTLYCQENYQ